ncbi:MAG: hypothetical protein H0W50_04275 [Parachlamydiaceae bacterium]|nr:hypothetical protein [Parachlamydiaceae bacterium]
MSNINSLEHRLFNVDFNNLKDLEAIKEDAKSQFEAGSLTHEKRTLILNTILVLNEVIMNTSADLLPEGDAAKELYADALHSSVKYLTNVASQDKDQLKDNFDKSVQSVNSAWKSLSNGEPKKQEARQMLEDLMFYGTSSLTATTDRNEDICVNLRALDASIEMLPTTGDGNCFYNAISTGDWILQHQGQLVTRDDKHEEGHAELRLKTIEHMKTLKVPNSLVSEHSKNGYWATEMQIQYLAGAEKKPILVLALNPNKNGELCGSIYAKEGVEVKPDELRVIVNLDNVHFNALYTTAEAREKLVKKFNAVPVE